MRPFLLALLLVGCGPAAETAQPPAKAPSAAASPQSFKLAFPLACRIGESCEVQQYVDRDPGPGARDYRCLERTYQEHGGIDIRAPDQRATIDVLAAAAGKVLRVRDGVADRMPDVAAVQAEGRECGNGVVIDHGDGYQTQYCHLAQGSIRVSPGQQVGAGEPIARLGQSGLAQFPHLHLTVRRAGQTIDPFAPEPGETCEPQSPLWDAAALRQLAYKRGAVLNAGFTVQPVEMAALEARSLPPAGREAPGLVAYVRAIGLEGGDVQELTVRSPDGSVLATSRAEPLQRARAQHMMFVGKKRPANGWPPGVYRAHYQVLREGQPALERSFEIRL